MDPDQLSDVYVQLKPHYLSFIRKRTDREAEDVLHDAVYKALNASHNGSEIRKIGKYLWNAIRSVLIDDSRKAATQKRDASVYPLVEDMVATEPPEYRWDEVEQVILRIKTLPENQREVLVLYSLGEMSCPEIADWLGASEGAIKQRLHRARTSLRS